MRLRRIEISAELLQDGLATGREQAPFRIIAGLPQGAKLRRASVSGGGDLLLDFEHEVFNEVPPMQRPEAMPVFLEAAGAFPRRNDSIQVDGEVGP